MSAFPGSVPLGSQLGSPHGVLCTYWPFVSLSLVIPTMLNAVCLLWNEVWQDAKVNFWFCHAFTKTCACWNFLESWLLKLHSVYKEEFVAKMPTWKGAEYLVLALPCSRRCKTKVSAEIGDCWGLLWVGKRVHTWDFQGIDTVLWQRIWKKLWLNSWDIDHQRLSWSQCDCWIRDDKCTSKIKGLVMEDTRSGSMERAVVSLVI